MYTVLRLAGSLVPAVCTYRYLLCVYFVCLVSVRLATHLCVHLATLLCVRRTTPARHLCLSCMYSELRPSSSKGVADCTYGVATFPLTWSTSSASPTKSPRRSSPDFCTIAPGSLRSPARCFTPIRSRQLAPVCAFASAWPAKNSLEYKCTLPRKPINQVLPT